MAMKKTSTKSVAKAAGTSADAGVPQNALGVSFYEPVGTGAEVQAVETSDAHDAAAEDAVEPGEPAEEVVMVKLKGLVDDITELSGVNKQDVRKVAEVLLQHLGDALLRGESLSLPGLGRVRVLKKASEESPMLKLRLRPFDMTKQKPGGKSEGSAETDDTETLADDSEDV